MLVVPIEIRSRYAEFLAQRSVAQIYVNKCQKWLRYYLDFCSKYQHKTTTAQSLESFLVKLTVKNQTVATGLEAKRAIQLYHEFLNLNRIDDSRSKRPENVQGDALNILT